MRGETSRRHFSDSSIYKFSLGNDALHFAARVAICAAHVRDKSKNMPGKFGAPEESEDF